MKFGILVNEGPYQHQASDTAYQFTKAALEKGHKIFRVFFYHDGVYNATSFSAPPQDDRNVAQQWMDLAEKYDLDLEINTYSQVIRAVEEFSEIDKAKLLWQLLKCQEV